MSNSIIVCNRVCDRSAVFYVLSRDFDHVSTCRQRDVVAARCSLGLRLFVLCGMVQIILVYFEKYFRSISNNLSEMILN